MKVKDLLKNKFVILDGAMGTMLQQKGMEVGTVPETLNILMPEWIVDIHRQYIEAGSQIIYANTFGANRLKMAGTEYTVAQIVEAAIRNARCAAGNTETCVALDMGPIGQLLEPTGSLTFEEAYDIFKEIVIAGRDADLIIIETMTDLYETKAAVLAAKENSDLPVFVTMTFEENGRTFTGCSVSAMCLTLSGLGIEALGVNCSLGPKDLVPIVEEISRWSDLPIIVKPNAGLPDPVTNKYNVGPGEFANECKSMIAHGARIMGGCCGTSPAYIAELKRMLGETGTESGDAGSASMVSETGTESGDAGAVSAGVKIRDMAICSPLKTVVISEPRIIGERINPTGKKRFRQALKEEDMDYILGMAIQQVEAGADILDVNVGAPGIDEKAMMVKVIKALQSVVDVPLQIDSTKPEVLEAALRVYNGKPIVNSVNGEKAVMDKILPLVAKYGAAVVGLTLDEDGIPKDADGRIRIAEKIVHNAASYGIKKENIAIDCLVLTVSAEQKAAMETLNAVRRVREDLGLKNVLGVSNISFGLPNRSTINTSFLTMALFAGLDLPIMNPNLPQMMWTVKSFKVLAGYDQNSLGFIEYSAEHQPVDAQLAEVKKDLDEVRRKLDESNKQFNDAQMQLRDASDMIDGMRDGFARMATYAYSFVSGNAASSDGTSVYSFHTESGYDNSVSAEGGYDNSVSAQGGYIDGYSAEGANNGEISAEEILMQAAFGSGQDDNDPAIPAFDLSNHPIGCMCEKCRAVNNARAKYLAKKGLIPASDSTVVSSNGMNTVTYSTKEMLNNAGRFRSASEVESKSSDERHMTGKSAAQDSIGASGGGSAQGGFGAAGIGSLHGGRGTSGGSSAQGDRGASGGGSAESGRAMSDGAAPQNGLTSPLGAGILKAMERGLKKDGRKLTGDLLRECSAMEIINDVLIPALDMIGEKFEKGKIFLPQLILAADVASECFEVIKTQIAESGETSSSRGKIILATVKGDIHDIGKNIVKVILENYGYEVIDLGKDVDPAVVVKAAIEKDVHLVGLSALMTTTLGSMEETIKQLHENNVDCKIMVGGAVLTPEYAKKIRADFYAKDAKMSADIAKEVLG